MTTTYWNYLRLGELLDLQGGVERDETRLGNDEVLFVVVHQVHELWFKLTVRELETARDLFRQDPVPETALAAAARGLRRISRILQLAAGHLSLMETMTTRDYLDFRDKLTPASGFQSAQFREVEILLGLADDERIPFGSEKSYTESLESAPLDRVRRRQEDRPTFRAALETWLARTPIQGSRPGAADDDAVVTRFLEEFLSRHEEEVSGAIEGARGQALTEEDVGRLAGRYRAEIQGAREFLLVEDPERRRVRAAILFIESYRELPLLAWPREILDLVIDLEQSFLIFRQRHARMVERMIGRRVGTGGSAGVEYLDQTALEYRVFRDLWAVRTLLLRRARLPPLEHAEHYQFRNG